MIAMDTKNPRSNKGLKLKVDFVEVMISRCATNHAEKWYTGTNKISAYGLLRIFL